MQDYMEVKANGGGFAKFWAQLREAWFQKYPEHQILFPGKLEGELDDAEAGAVTAAIEKRIGVCKIHALKHLM